MAPVLHSVVIITFSLCMLIQVPTAQMAPAVPNLGVVDPKDYDNTISIDHTISPEPMSTTILPANLSPDTSTPTPTASIPSTTFPSSTTATPSSSNKKLARLVDGTPVDLYDPCNLEDEDWSDGYFHSEEPKDDDDEHYDVDTDESHSAESKDLRALTNHTENQEELDHMTGKVKLGYSVLQEMIHKSNHLQGLVTDMIRNNLIKECRHLELPGVMEIPKYNLSDSNNLVKMLSGIYRTLANQTAHHYFKWKEQLELLSNTKTICSQHGRPTHHDGQGSVRPAALNGTTTKAPRPSVPLMSKRIRMHAEKVAGDFLSVSHSLRALMCNFKQAFHLFDIHVPTKQIVQQVLDHSYMSSVLCVRMTFVDCQLMKNSVSIFAQIEEFLRKNNMRFFAHAKSANKKLLHNSKQPLT